MDLSGARQPKKFATKDQPHLGTASTPMGGGAAKLSQSSLGEDQRDGNDHTLDL